MSAAVANSKLKTENAELTLSDRRMTCPACSRVLPVNDKGYLPLHENVMDEFCEEEESGMCPGSYTKAAPHRMDLPEAGTELPRGFSFIELVPDGVDDPDTRKRVEEILQCARFMAELTQLGVAQLAQSLNTPTLVGIVQQTSRARSASLGLMK
jgi:hypothetical protein